MVSPPRSRVENFQSLAADPIFRESLFKYHRLHRRIDCPHHAGGPGAGARDQHRVPGARYCMSAMFLTNLMPILAVCLVWRFLLHPYGLVNQLLAPLRRRTASTG